MLDLHLIPRIGDRRLVDLNIEIVSDLRAEMAADGVGPVDPQGADRAAVDPPARCRLAADDRNPVRDMRKPSQARRRVVRPLSPNAVERMRAYLLATGRRLDATLVSVLAYAGLRPGAAIGLRRHDLRERTLLVGRSVAFG